MSRTPIAACFLVLMSPQVATSQRAEQVFDSMFCSYVTTFTEQVALNRIRNIPFNRLRDFKYFDFEKSEFLEEVAREIYSMPDADIQSTYTDVGARYESLCEELFGA